MGCTNEEEVKKFGNYVVGTSVDWGYATHCMVCGSTISITAREATGVCLKICDECKQAIKWAKLQMRSKTKIVIENE